MASTELLDSLKQYRVRKNSSTFEFSESAWEKTIKLPIPEGIASALPGEEIIVRKTRQDRSPKGVFTVEVDYIDPAYKRPTETKVFKVHGIEIEPAQVKRFSYEVEKNFLYPHSRYQENPVSVHRVTTEIWNVGRGVGKEKRFGVEVNRVLYLTKSNEDLIKPYVLLSKSIYEKAPKGWLGTMGESKKNSVWAEAATMYPVAGIVVLYERSTEEGTENLMVKKRFEGKGSVKLFKGFEKNMGPASTVFLSTTGRLNSRSSY